MILPLAYMTITPRHCNSNRDELVELLVCNRKRTVMLSDGLASPTTDNI
jgi:hypothetical protein